MDYIEDDSMISIQDYLLIDSRFTPSGNGNINGVKDLTQPTNGQKWWASVLLGLVFAIISSPPAYSIISSISKNTLGIKLEPPSNINFNELLIQTLLFIVIVRFILW
jgi:hypothetical protein